MISEKERNKEIIKWSFPHDKNNPTVFHLKRVSGPKMAYLRLSKLQIMGEYSEQDWVTDQVLNYISKIENWDEKTLTTPEEINNAIEFLNEDEMYLLLAAIQRRGDAYVLGLVEKNSDSRSG